MDETDSIVIQGGEIEGGTKMVIIRMDSYHMTNDLKPYAAFTLEEAAAFGAAMIEASKQLA